MDRSTHRALMEQLVRDAELLASEFGLRYRVIEPESPRVRTRYGVCYADGTIRIRLRHALNGRPLKYSSLVNTLCHELAHLRHFNHGPRFKAFYFQILERARFRGIYRPGRPAEPAVVSRPVAPAPPPGRDLAPGPPSRAVQLDLFAELWRSRR